MTEPTLSAADLKRMEAQEVKAYALELQKALTGLTRGGSEYFVRRGDEFRADIPRCVADVRARQADAHKRTCEAIRRQKDVEERLRLLEGALEGAEKALNDAGEWFEDYGDGHALKDPPDNEKAKRNYDRGGICIQAAQDLRSVMGGEVVG